MPGGHPTARPLISTGVAGLDDIVNSGLEPGRVYLVEGMPGTGKTTLSLQFLLTGRAAGETVIYVTLSESEQELRVVKLRGSQYRGGYLDFNIDPGGLAV